MRDKADLWMFRRLKKILKMFLVWKSFSYMVRKIKRKLGR